MQSSKRAAPKVWIAATAILIILVVALAGAYLYYPSTISQMTTTTVYQTTTPEMTTAATPSKQYKMAVVVGGDETDDGFNMIGIQAAEYIQSHYNWSVSISRDVSYADQARVITTLAQGGYDLVWVHGNQFIGTTEGIAKQFPNTHFAQSPDYYQNFTSNIVALDQSFQVTGYYLAGVLAGKMTHTNAVAVIIGQWFPSLSMEFYAFQAGAQSVNPNVKVYARVAGTWADATLGLQISQALIQTHHVDIIAPIADATGRGAFTAAQLYNATVGGNQYKVSIIGTVADQADLAPDNVMTSVLMDTKAFISNVVEHIMSNTWSEIGGKDLFMNLGSLAPFHYYDSVVPDSVKALLATTTQQIQSGQIVVQQKVTQTPPADPT